MFAETCGAIDLKPPAAAAPGSESAQGRRGSRACVIVIAQARSLGRTACCSPRLWGRSRGVKRTLASLRQQQGKERRRLEKKAAEGERRVARLTLVFAEIRFMLSAQIAERDACRRALTDLEAEPTLVMMPDLAERYRRSIADLAKALSGDAVEQAREAYASGCRKRQQRPEGRWRMYARGGCGSRIWSKTYIGYRACLMAAEMRLSSDLSHLPAYGALKPGA